MRGISKISKFPLQCPEILLVGQDLIPLKKMQLAYVRLCRHASNIEKRPDNYTGF